MQEILIAALPHILKMWSKNNPTTNLNSPQLKWLRALDLNHIVEVCADHFDNLPRELQLGADGIYTDGSGIDREFSQVYGIDDRIQRLMGMIDESKNDPNISRLTADIIRPCRPHDARCELTKIFNYTKSPVSYTHLRAHET